MSFDVCPACKGAGGRYVKHGLRPKVFVKCTVCDGKKIINNITGLPPDGKV